jgi:hypothetical protein
MCGGSTPPPMEGSPYGWAYMAGARAGYVGSEYTTCAVRGRA